MPVYIDFDADTADADANAVTPSRNTRSYTRWSVPSSLGRSFFHSWRPLPPKMKLVPILSNWIALYLKGLGVWTLGTSLICFIFHGTKLVGTELNIQENIGNIGRIWFPWVEIWKKLLYTQNIEILRVALRKKFSQHFPQNFCKFTKSFLVCQITLRCLR